MVRFSVIAALLGTLSATTAQALPRPVVGPDRDYVLGRFAYASDRLPDAARYFEAARREAPGDPVLARRAFDLAVAAGDEKLAVTLANQLAANGHGDSTVALIRLADALQRRDWNAADAARPGLADAGYAAVVAPIVAAWTLYGRGQVDAALAGLDPAKFEGFARSYVTEHRAAMLAAAKRYDAAAADYATLLAGVGQNVVRLRIAAAAAQQGAGRAAEAAKTLGTEADEPQLDAARSRLAAGKPLAVNLVAEPRQGVAWLAARLATDLSREKPVPLALVFARVAIFLAPEYPETWLIAGDVLARGERTDAALAAYAHVPEHDPLGPLAATRRALVLTEAGRDAEARPLLEAAANAKGATSEDWARLGDLDRKASRYGDAVQAYDRALALAGTASGAPAGAASGTSAAENWTLYFLRGSAYEQAGDFAHAEPDLRRALQLSPQEPVVLNYLGYALLDRGKKLPEAQALIEAAAKLRPGDGFIVDSLGWLYYRTGQYDKAVATLERAVAAEPGDPAINDHLGDAYWRVGRKLEARFRWRAAVDLGIPAALLAGVKVKLDYGLDVALVQAPVPAAPPTATRPAPKQ